MTTQSFAGGGQAIQAEQYAFPYHYIPKWSNKFYLSRHWGFAPSYISALGIIADSLRPVAKDLGDDWRHIDIGCGDGALVYHLAQLFSLGPGQLSGVDIDDRAIAWARMFNPNATLHCSDIGSLEGGFHSATLVEVLEHVSPDSLPRFVQSAVRLVSPGGRIVVTVPSVEKPLAEKHFQHFSFESIRAVLEPSLEVLATCGFERHTALTRILGKLRMNRFLRIDAPSLNRMHVNHLGRLYTDQRGCGRLLVVGRRTS